MTCQFESDSPLYKELDTLYSAAFEELEVPFHLQAMPVQRSITDVDRARADGNCLRIRALVERGPYPNLVLVDIPLISITFDVWVLGVSGGYPNFTDIVANGGLVGFERGVWIVERQLAALVPPKQLVAVADARSGVEMLAAKRISALVHSEMKIAEAVASAEQRRSVTIRRAGTLISADLFPILHEKHRVLAPKLAQVLRGQLEKFCVQNEPLPLLCEFYRQKFNHPTS